MFYDDGQLKELIKTYDIAGPQGKKRLFMFLIQKYNEGKKESYAKIMFLTEQSQKLSNRVEMLRRGLPENYSE